MDELPDDLRTIQVEIVDEYGNIEHDFLDTAAYLRRVTALVRSKLAKSQPTTDTGAGGGGKAKGMARTPKGKPQTKREQIRQQRIKFATPRRARGESFQEIFDAYWPKHQKNDPKASADAFRLMLDYWKPQT